MFDDNEVIIKDWNKIRFISDVFIPNDVLINFHSLVIVINYVIEKNDESIPEIYIDEGYFEKVWYKMNKVKELKIDSTENNKTGSSIKVHQVRYENGGFYLTIDNVKGYFSFIDNIVVLNMIFSNDD